MLIVWLFRHYEYHMFKFDYKYSLFSFKRVLLAHDWCSVLRFGTRRMRTWNGRPFLSEIECRFLKRLSTWFIFYQVPRMYLSSHEWLHNVWSLCRDHVQHGITRPRLVVNRLLLLGWTCTSPVQVGANLPCVPHIPSTKVRRLAVAVVSTFASNQNPKTFTPQTNSRRAKWHCCCIQSTTYIPGMK